jgi:hypothetical protein
VVEDLSSLDDISESLGNFALVFIKDESSGAGSAGEFIGAVLAEGELASLAFLSSSIRVGSSTALSRDDAGSVILEEASCAFNAVVSSSFDALVTSGIALFALFLVAVTEEALGAVNDASGLGLDEVESTGAVLAGSLLVAGSTANRAFDAGVIGSFSVSSGAGAYASVLVKLERSNALKARVDVSRAGSAFGISAGDTDTVESDFTDGAGVVASAVFFEGESNDALLAGLSIDAVGAGGTALHAGDSVREGLGGAGLQADIV